MLHLAGTKLNEFSKVDTPPCVVKMISSGNVDKAALGLLVAAAVAMFAPISKARPGFFNTFYAISFDTFNPFLPRFLKKSARPSDCITLSPTIIDFFLLQIEH